MRVRATLLTAATTVPVASIALVAVLATSTLPAAPATGAASGGSAALRAAASTHAGWSTSAHRVARRPASAPLVTGIRVGHHRGFDRVVLDLTGRAPGYTVRYVRTLTRDPSGLPVELAGPATLQVTLDPANGHDPRTGRNSLATPARTLWRLDQVKETRVVGDVEAVFTVGVGLGRRAPFRVLTLHSPTRIVVDVRH